VICHPLAIARVSSAMNIRSPADRTFPVSHVTRRLERAGSPPGSAAVCSTRVACWSGRTAVRSRVVLAVFIMLLSQPVTAANEKAHQTTQIKAFMIPLPDNERVIYVSYMATTGRPPERPVHLSPEDRQLAQIQTAQWRRETGLSQPEMAGALLVSTATYRGWESSKDPHAGPTRPLAAKLDHELQRRLPGRYTAGDALRIWGWAAAGDMSLDRLAGLLRSTGFDVPNSHAAAPTHVFWVHRVHEPNLLHAVFTLAAAAATRAGLSVRLLLDDMTLAAWERASLRANLESRIRTWFSFAAGHEGKLSIGFYSEVLTADLLADRGWRTASRYLTAEVEVLRFLLAAKVVSPAQYRTESEESVLAILRQSQSLHADMLLTALRNWIVFEQEIENLLLRVSDDVPIPIVTLGGEDERHLWELWHSCCSDDLTSRVQHIYIDAMPMPRYRSVWTEPALFARVSRPTLTEYLRSRIVNERNHDAAEWMIKAAINLPAVLNEDFMADLDPITLDTGALFHRPGEEVAAAVAKAVVQWLNQ
jgi:transcriptional regulator with XRE-family HTH domain